MLIEKQLCSIIPDKNNEVDAEECFHAISEIKSILLSSCLDELVEEPFVAETESSSRNINSSDDLSPGEQLKAVMLAYLRSARFCDYPENKGPGVRGYWSMIPGGAGGIEIGTSMYTGVSAIANRFIHLELAQPGAWDEPLNVLIKVTCPYKRADNLSEIHSILNKMANAIPKEHRDFCARTYGHMVCEVVVKPSYIIKDSCGDNFADSISKNLDGSFTILGRNTSNEPRAITLHSRDQATGYKGSQALGIVECQLFSRREEIFNYFDLDINHEFQSSNRPNGMTF